MSVNTIPDKIPKRFLTKLKRGKYDDIILFTLAVFGPHKYKELVNNASNHITDRMEEDIFHDWTNKLKTSEFIEEYKVDDDTYFKATSKGKDELFTRIGNSSIVNQLKSIFYSVLEGTEQVVDINSKSISGFTLSFRDFIFGLLSIYWRLDNFLDTGKETEKISQDGYFTLAKSLEENAEKFPNNAAILYEDIKYTHKEQNEWMNRYANYFLSLGVNIGEVINIFVENRPELIFLIGAMSKIGTIGSLINTRQRSATLLHSLKLNSVKIYIIGEELIQPFEEIRPKLGLTGDDKLFFLKDKGDIEIPEGFIDLKREIINQSINNPSTTTKMKGKDPFAYIFTSGTTGLPKAAPIRNAHLIRSSYGWGLMALHMTPEDIMYISLPLYHSNAILIGWGSAIRGSSAIAIARKFSARTFWKDIIKFRATCFNFIGEICRYLYNQQPSAIERQHKVVKICGNGLRPEMWMDFKSRFGIRAVYEHYGATEMNSMFCNYFNLDCTVGMNFDPHAIVKYDIDNNIPIRNNDGFLERVKEGQAGLLLIDLSSQYRFAGYTDKVATQKKIITDAFEKGDRWLNTGDLLRNIGYFHAQFVDRLGDTFRWKGENVSTAEVEDIISSFTGIEHVSVFGVEIPGTEGRAGISSITTNQNHSDFDFKGYLKVMKENLPQYAIPKFIRFLSELATTGTHKIQKSNMKEIGFNINETDDPIYVHLPGSSQYALLTENIYLDIINKKYRF